ncbi:hypothetical protein FQ377_13750 [Arthrobacter echini]|uniref:Uncharacterized protein n=1 Tax=Arthrobacter echini TaxID=1529066 RepID=A0A5D0XL07_9MICC|nr:hypothetical protein [Arthrobacter echini]TYC96591.1 hypothetical protein FQ377_13750 [Arthrobacter echini]
MSEEGIDDVVERGLRQLLAAGGQMAERIARLRQDLLRREQQTIGQAGYTEARQVTTDRTNMRAVLAPVNEARWWDTASAEHVTRAYEAAQAWKDYDPAALAATKTIHDEIRTRYGIDTNDLGGDNEFLQDAINTRQQGGPDLNAMREHTEAMALIAAANIEKLRNEAHDLATEVERLEVPQEYLTDPQLLDALKRSHVLEEGAARTDAERIVAERVHLMNEDGVNGPTIDQLSEEIGANYSGTDSSLFQDPEFVSAAKDWHDARVLAEGGFADRDPGLEARYEAKEKELFDRIAGLGHDIENEVLKDVSNAPRDTAPAEVAPTVKYGSPKHRAEFATKLEGTGTPEEIRGRLIAATDQGRHPREAVRATTKKPKQPTKRPTTGVGRHSTKGGPTR